MGTLASRSRRLGCPSGLDQLAQLESAQKARADSARRCCLGHAVTCPCARRAAQVRARTVALAERQKALLCEGPTGRRGSRGRCEESPRMTSCPRRDAASRAVAGDAAGVHGFSWLRVGPTAVSCCGGAAHRGVGTVRLAPDSHRLRCPRAMYPAQTLRSHRRARSAMLCRADTLSLLPQLAVSQRVRLPLPGLRGHQHRAAARVSGGRLFSPLPLRCPARLLLPDVWPAAVDNLVPRRTVCPRDVFSATGRTSSARISRRRNGPVARAARWIAMLRRPGPHAAADASCCRAFSLSTMRCCASQRVCAEGGLSDAKLSAWRRRLVSVRGSLACVCLRCCPALCMWCDLWERESPQA